MTDETPHQTDKPKRKAAKARQAWDPGPDWQDVPQDAVCVPGLQFRIDPNNGVRQARRLPPEPEPQKDEPRADTGNGPMPDYLREAIARALAGQQQAPAAPNIITSKLDWTTLAGRMPPARSWIWPDQVPAGTATYLHGGGGVGKTTLLQQLATSVALGLPMLGGDPLEPGVALAWFGEDDHDELWRRQVAINRALGVADPAAALQRMLKPNGHSEPADPNGLLQLAGNATFLALPGTDITLFIGKNEGDYNETPTLKTLREQIGDLKAKLVILDSVAKIYGGPENNRPLVTRCIQALIGVCIDLNTTIIINGHDNKSGETYSGSTAWENTVRSRLHFRREAEMGEDNKPLKGGTSHMCLVRAKANYAALDDIGLPMKWHNGAFVSLAPELMTPEMLATALAADAADEQTFLDALDTLTKQQRSLSAGRTARNYAPKEIVEAGLSNGLPKPRIEKAMNRLFNAGALVANALLPWKTSSRHPAIGIARKTT